MFSNSLFTLGRCATGVATPPALANPAAAVDVPPAARIASEPASDWCS